MSQTTTPSGAEYDAATAKVLCDTMDATIARSSDRVKTACGYVDPSGAAEVDMLAAIDDVLSTPTGMLPDEFAALTKARTAVAALIARNAELEAQTPRALREKLRSCEEALQAIEADRDALAGERDALRNDLENAWAEADALRS